MNATAEIDKSGRLVVPKKLREVLHLVPGTRLTLSHRDGALLLEPEVKPRGLYMKRGTLVYDAGPVPPSDVVEWVTETRDARARATSGTPAKP